MKFLIISFFFLLFSCRNENSKPNDIDSKKISNEIKTQFKEIKRDTLIVNNLKFVIKQFKEGNLDFSLVILNEKFDTIYKHNDFIDEYKIIDFNNDGYQDIELDYITNVPGIVDVLLFDLASGKFQIIEELGNYPSPIKIKKSEYYYSYERAGCADYNWESNLFYISDYKCVKIGNITGKGCGYEKRNGIFINKIVNNKEVEINWIKRDTGYYEDKWEFIEKYWTKNHLKFTK